MVFIGSVSLSWFFLHLYVIFIYRLSKYTFCQGRVSIRKLGEKVNLDYVQMLHNYVSQLYLSQFTPLQLRLNLVHFNTQSGSNSFKNWFSKNIFFFKFPRILKKKNIKIYVILSPLSKYDTGNFYSLYYHFLVFIIIKSKKKDRL